VNLSKGLTIGEDGIKATITFSTEHIMEAVNRAGHKAVLVLTDPDAWVAGLEQFKAQADQPALPLD
jgi:hypothetical protein